MSQQQTAYREPTYLRGAYNDMGVIQLDPNGSELIKVEYSRIQYQWQASVYVNNICKGYVTFGMNGERIISTFAQGFGDDMIAETSIHNIVNGIH
ncbi:hypothetical protein [Vibrio phage phiKT1028]|nr:hypothetical protein [Vibrio phage phiKT1028]